MPTIGVLALQGAVVEHIKKLQELEGVSVRLVKKVQDFIGLDGLILPGGESTAIGKLLDDFNITECLKENIADGLPVWGTCAGMILLAKKISNHQKTCLGVMDIEVQRNAYGSQLDSFSTHANVSEVSVHELPLIFIRAPYVEKVWGNVNVLATVDEKIVACRQGNMLATAFHPELADGFEFYEYFLKMIKNS